MEIKKISKMGPYKIVYIPKQSELQAGDYVKIVKVKNEEEVQV